MADADRGHYCCDCGTHFNADPQEHIDTYHDGYMAEIEDPHSPHFGFV